MSRQTLVIGDVHGCAHELEDLLDLCAYASGDDVVLVGDAVAKGPLSREVLALMRQVRARSVRGNHDHAVLRWRATLEDGSATQDGGPPHLRVARTLSPDDWAVLEAMTLWLSLPELSVVVVHAGLVPGIPVAEQEPDMLMNLRTIRADGRGSRRADDGMLWGELYQGPELVLFGHHAMRGLQRHKHAIGLDTGCVYGGRLTAYVLSADRFVSVPARETYVTVDDAPRAGAM
jgi:diadenosine tetraphosphatase ApaH/serine/threonine PP2A family protein phosphatase